MYVMRVLMERRLIVRLSKTGLAVQANLKRRAKEASVVWTVLLGCKPSSVQGQLLLKRTRSVPPLAAVRKSTSWLSGLSFRHYMCDFLLKMSLDKQKVAQNEQILKLIQGIKRQLFSSAEVMKWH